MYVAKRFAVTTCFNYLGLSRLIFEHPTFHIRYKRSDKLRNRRSLWSSNYKTVKSIYTLDLNKVKN